ncbi:MAG: acetyl-CoA C-acetyltransferase [Planctomycetes bacterium]|nr:acetyl-CoA C-acetyltransferase [Planctomycetota bacterium]MBI3846087.1 acetyl-CoA C-acetyltransferase [Planctomycetota bacterium]
MTTELVFVGPGARTPMAEYSGTPGFGLFKDVSAIDLGAIAAKAALERARVKPSDVNHVVFGNALQTSNDAIYGARHVGLKAGAPIETPALTVNRLCGSGFEAIVQGARMIRLGEADLCLVGGMESMSQAPHVMHGLREGARFGVKFELEDLLFSALMDPMCGLFMAQTAEKLAQKYSISRAEQDAYALRSHREGARAVKEGMFGEEIVPVEVKRGRETVTVTTDDHIKPDTSAEALSKLRAAFGKDGTVTAGNASGIVDGAAALVLTTREKAKRLGLDIHAKLVGWGTAGVPPEIMGIGPAPAIRKALESTGLKLANIDLVEVNEAFSAQYLAVEKELGLDRDRVNVNGGAIALGHPLGATGARITLTLIRELRRRRGRYGVGSACIGGGQGIAVVVERE